MKGYDLHYSAPDAVPLDWKGINEKRDANEKEAEKMEGGVLYELQDKEYILQHGFNLYHIRFDRDLGSCACSDFEYKIPTTEPAVPCKHIIRVRNILANETDRIKPVDPRIAEWIKKHYDDKTVDGSHITAPPEEARSPASSTTEPEPETEYTFICSICQAGIPTEQRNASYEKHKRAVCVDCESKLTGSSEKKKDYTLRYPPGEDVPPPIDKKELGRALGQVAGTEKANPKKSYLCQGGQHRDCGGHECDCSCHTEKPQEKKEPEAPKDNMRKKYDEDHKERLPARRETPKPPALSDAELDAQIEKAKAEKFLTQRGGSYTVQGKERPDSHMIQAVANDKSISCEILEATQTDKFVHVVVRGHCGNQYIDDAVHHDFETGFQLKLLEIVSKNPDILQEWDGIKPVIKQGAKIRVMERGREVYKDAFYFISHALLTYKNFALRDAVTKAMSRAEAKLLNRDWRDPEEKLSEESEKAMVEEDIRNRQSMKTASCTA